MYQQFPSLEEHLTKLHVKVLKTASVANSVQIRPLLAIGTFSDKKW